MEDSLARTVSRQTGLVQRLTVMRRGLAIFLIINLLGIAFLVRSVFTLLTLLVEDGSADAIHSPEIPAPLSPLIDNMSRLIPKIIHQTYVNESVPELWREAQKSCIDLHKDYEYKVRSRRLILSEEIIAADRFARVDVDRCQITRADRNRVPLVSQYF